MVFKFLSILTFLFFSFQTPFLAMADRKLIENTCKGTPSYNLCLSTLLSNPKSSNGDVTDLGLIMVDATKAKASKTLEMIRSLHRSRPELKRALHICEKKYNAVMIGDVPMALSALHSGQVKYAEDGMADAAIEAQSCERSFGEHGQKSPLTEMNKDLQDVSNVARAIIRMLL